MARIIQQVLQSETWSLSSGHHRWFKRSTRKKRPVTRGNNNNNNTNNISCNIYITNRKRQQMQTMSTIWKCRLCQQYEETTYHKYQHAQYVLAKNNTYTDMIQHVLPHARKSG